MSDVTATSEEAQDIPSRIEEALYGGSDETELEESHDDVVSDDDENLPEDDDTDSEDDDSSELVDEEETEEESDLSLAGYLGLDDEKIAVKDDGSVVFNAVIDGESKEVPLTELAKSYQLQGHVNNKSIALQNERKEFENQRNVIANDFQQKLNNVNEMTKALEEQLLGDFERIDWDRLRVENPAEWTALRQEYSDKAQSLQKIQDRAKGESDKVLSEKQQALQQGQAKYMQDQLNKMVEANPTWSDKEVLVSETNKLKSFLSDSYGFSDEDIALVTDHRLIGLIQDAKSFRDGKKSVETKIVKKVPKFQKPGAVKTNAKTLAKARSVKANKQALKRDGSLANAAKSIIDRM